MNLPGTTVVAGVPRGGPAITPGCAAGCPGSADSAAGRDLDVATVRRSYRDEELPLRDTAAAVGRGPDTAPPPGAGVAIRVPVVDVGDVRRWLDAGTPLSEIARQVGRSPGSIRSALRDAGVPVPPARPPLDPQVVRALYWQDGLSLGKIAARLGCSAGRVGSAMRAAGIPRRDAHDRPVRPPGPWWVTREELTVLYVDRALTARQVAAELGCDPAWVTTALRRYRITRPVDPVRLDVDRATLTRLYVTERLDDPQIAARYGVPPWRVTRRRRELDVHRPRTRHPDTPTPDPPAADEHLASPTRPVTRAWRRCTPTPRSPRGCAATKSPDTPPPPPARGSGPGRTDPPTAPAGLPAHRAVRATNRVADRPGHPAGHPRPAHPPHPRPRRPRHLPLAEPPRRVTPARPPPQVTRLPAVTTTTGHRRRTSR